MEPHGVDEPSMRMRLIRPGDTSRAGYPYLRWALGDDGHNLDN